MKVKIIDHSVPLAQASVGVKRTEQVEKIDLNKIIPKNPNQIISISAENQIVGSDGNFMGCYQAGGVAPVAQQASDSLKDDMGGDIRSVLPYHNGDENHKGKMRIIRFPREERIKRAQKGDKYEFPKLADPKWVYEVPQDYEAAENEYYAVIDDNKVGDKFRYILLKDTKIKGEITSLKEAYMETQRIPYRIFEHKDEKGKITYFVHTPQVSAMKRAYGGDAAYKTGQIIGSFYDAYYADWGRAVIDAGRQLAERYDFNPANIWLHDRQAYSCLYDICRRSSEGDHFYDGTKIHCTFHNPGEDYQGWFGEIASFMRIAFNEKDFIKLKSHPQYYALKRILDKPQDKRTKLDVLFIEKIFIPYFQKMLDEKGDTNQTMTAVAGVKENPDVVSWGTVSGNYGVEMSKYRDIAPRLTSKLAEIKDKAHHITNGNAPAALDINTSLKSFGRPKNGISSKHQSEYTPYKPELENGKVTNYFKSIAELKPEIKEEIEASKKKKEDAENRIIYLNKHIEEVKRLDSIDEKGLAELEEERNKVLKELQESSDKINLNTHSIKETRAINKKWLLNLLKEQYVEGNPEETKKKLEEFFYDENQRTKDKYDVLGYIKPSEDGKDILYTNWGRPDPQKGYTTFLQGFYKFLTMEQPPEGSGITKEKLEDMKIHAKLLFGSGKGAWDKNDPEYKIIKEYIDKIQHLENGKYAGSICYVNGFFPGRLVTCVDYSLFTSRFEPCGITPLESYSAGTPVASIRTGGAPNFVFDKDETPLDKATGFLTERPFMLDDTELESQGKMDIEKVHQEIMGDGIEWNSKKGEKEYKEVLDEVRRDASSDEVAQLFFRTSSTDEATYDQMSKNCLEQHIGWAENGAYNNGKSADERYLEEVFGVTGKLGENGERVFEVSRSIKPLKPLTGSFPAYVNIEEIKKEHPEANVSFKGLASVGSINLYSNKNVQNNKSKIFIG